jgi:hypothetical protein
MRELLHRISRHIHIEIRMANIRQTAFSLAPSMNCTRKNEGRRPIFTAEPKGAFMAWSSVPFKPLKAVLGF